jgi:hypothetical protein
MFGPLNVSVISVEVQWSIAMSIINFSLYKPRLQFDTDGVGAGQPGR